MKIFLSYRREDTSGHAGRLYDLLARRYGAEQIFMDIDAIPVGSEFAKEIHRAVASCDVFIALIGPRATIARPLTVRCIPSRALRLTVGAETMP